MEKILYKKRIIQKRDYIKKVLHKEKTYTEKRYIQKSEYIEKKLD